MKKTYKILTTLCILYFFIMMLLDIRFILQNEENVLSGMPASVENAIYVFIMFIPFLLLIILRFIVKLICKKKNILLVSPKKKARKKVKISPLIIVICFIILTITVLLFLQNKLLYHPTYDEFSYTRLSNTDNSSIEEIEFTDNGITYHGWGYKNSSTQPTIIYFGGNAQSSEAFFLNAEQNDVWNNYAECNIVMVDYPGYGLSEGKTSYDSILQMAEATYQYVANNSFYGNGEIIIMGFSLGTGVATYVASLHDVSGLILAAPYTNGKALYNNVCNIFHGPLELLIRNPYPSDDFAQDVNAPVLIIASKSDEVIPYELSLQLSNYFDDIEFIETNHLYHNEILDDENVQYNINRFLSNY